MHTPVLGIVGAGQLARMTYQAVVGLALPVRIFADREHDSAATVARDVMVGSWDTHADLETFARDCDVVTFDHELVDPAILAALQDAGHVLRPDPAASLFAQDKLHQRRELGARGFPVPPFTEVTSLDDLTSFADAHGWPVVAKSRRGGYDGRGVWVVADADEAAELWRDTAGAGVGLLVEAHVPIEREIAVAVVRRPSGEHVTYPVTETVQRDGICVELVAPADIGDDLRAARDRDRRRCRRRHRARRDHGGRALRDRRRAGAERARPAAAQLDALDHRGRPHLAVPEPRPRRRRLAAR